MTRGSERGDLELELESRAESEMLCVFFFFPIWRFPLRLSEQLHPSLPPSHWYSTLPILPLT